MPKIAKEFIQYVLFKDKKIIGIYQFQEGDTINVLGSFGITAYKADEYKLYQYHGRRKKLLYKGEIIQREITIPVFL